MKTQIQNTIAALASHLDYVQNNTDYTEQYDILLADDSVYHSEQWQSAIESAAGELAEYVNPYVLDKIITAIVENPTGYCDVSYVSRGFPHPSDDNCCSSFPIGELEYQVEDTPKFKPAIAYIERESEWTYSSGFFYHCAEYDSIDYVLREADIKDLIRDIGQTEWEDNAELLLCDARGQFIPRDFLDFEKFKDQLSAESIEVLSNPEHEWYWEEWDSVLNKTFLVDGTEWSLYQDGDLWAYKSGMDNSAWLAMGGR